MNKGHSLHEIKKTFVLFFFILAVRTVSVAQNQDVIIIDAYKPTISDAFKINDNPKITDSTIEKLNLNYQLNPKLYPTTFSLDPIKPAKMVGEPLTKLYKSFIKLGFGNKTTPLAEFCLNNTRSTSNSIGVYFDHLSSSGKIKNYGYPGFSDNKAGIYARKFYKNELLSCDINYSRNVIHYYGFHPSDYPLVPSADNKDSIRQRFSKIGGELKLKSTYLDSSHLNHAISLKYYNLSDLYHSTENYLGFNAGVNKNCKLLGKSLEHQNLGIMADMNFYSDVNKMDTVHGADIKLLPCFSAKYDILKFSIGLNALIQAADVTKGHLFPDANFSIDLFNNIFVLYGGITSELKRNNLIDLSAENPFINTSIPFSFSYTKSKFYAGFKGCISSYLSFDASISKSSVDNLPLFVSDTTLALQNKFTVVYDKVGIFNTHAEIVYQKSEKLKILLTSNYYQYTTTNEKKAWYMPDMDVKLSAEYNLRNKIILKAGVIGYSGCDAEEFVKGSAPQIKHLKGVADCNLGIEYRYTKILSAFLNFNNIGAERYQHWYNYPSYGFNVMAGLTYAL
jgi:hypothetical protein